VTPVSLAKLDDISVLLRAHLAEEIQAGFPKLSQIPSTGTIKFLDYFSTLEGADRDSLVNTLARLAAMRFFPPPLVYDEMFKLANTDPSLLRYRAGMQSAPFAMGLRYQGLRMVKAVLGDPESVKMMAQTRASLDFTPRDDPPAALAPDPDPAHYKPAKAPLLRKLIDKAFKDMFAGGKKKLPGGETGYTGVFEGTNVTVWIDFAGMGLQLRYGVNIPDESKTVFVWRLAYEDLWTGGVGWDYLTEENAESAIRLLGELVAQVVRLRNRVIAAM
jgi:hypothetical protein